MTVVGEAHGRFAACAFCLRKTFFCSVLRVGNLLYLCPFAKGMEIYLLSGIVCLSIRLLRKRVLAPILKENMKRADFVDYLSEQIEAVKRPHPVRVGIDGPDAAGKTRLADDLAKNLELRQERADFKRQIIRVMLDDFSNPKEIRYDLGRLSPRGYYEEAFNYEAFRNMVLTPMGPGGSRLFMDKLFDASNNMPYPSTFKRSHDEAILVVDGIFLFRPELIDKWDYKVFLDIDRQTALDRAMVRDRGRLGDAVMVRETYEKRYFPAQERYRFEAHPKRVADLVVNNTDPENPQIDSENFLGK